MVGDHYFLKRHKLKAGKYSFDSRVFKEAN